jgi:acetolactate synthase-1/2/3 large subunit
MNSDKIPDTHSEFLSDILNFQNSFQLLNQYCCSPNADVDIFVDAGNTGAFATHYLNPKGKNLFYISLGMGGMGNSIGAAMGSCFASGKKTYALVGDGAFLMYGLEIHTALQHQLPIVFIVFNNNSHGMCSTREDIFLGPQSGINNFTNTFFAQGFKNMFPQLQAAEVNSLSEFNSALQQMHPLNTTSLISVNIAVNTEVPPFQSFIKNSSTQKK